MPDEIQIKTQEEDKNKQSFDEYLTEVNLEFKEQEVKEKAKALGVPYIKIEEVPINTDILDYVERDDAEHGKLMPFYQTGKTLRIAVCDINKPETKEIIEQLKSKEYQVEVFLASEDGIKKAQQPYYSSKYFERKEKQAKVEEEDKIPFEEEIQNLSELQEKLKTIPMDEALQLIHVGAIKTNASDIHIQPLSEEDALIRFRIDGRLMDIFHIPYKTYDQIVKQIKYLSHLKLNIVKAPQDGKYDFKLNDRKIDMRVSTLPSAFGESMVIRLLDPKKGILSFEDLGFKEKTGKTMEMNLHKPNGLILVTGPTGSGKTTTLYAMLNFLNTSDRKLITLEDPVEYQMKGISQSQVDTENEYDFADGLRAILRQDPDVVMVGEIRDIETAQTAAQASLTGHIVLSTLHTNSAVESIPRLINMGLPSFMIAPSVSMIIAQRLVRRPCACALEKQPTESEKHQIQKVVETLKARNIAVPELTTLKTPKGCEKCSNTGFHGQTTIIETLEIDTELREMILNNEHSNTILKKAQSKGFLTMKEDGVLKILQGITTISEVWRVSQ